MPSNLWRAARRVSGQQWSGLGLAVGLGGLLVALLLGGLGARGAAAAGPAEPAVAYACSEAGLNAALAAGGSATFSCGAPTTVTVSTRKTVNKNVSLDGGQKLILSGGLVTGVFTVAAGVHLSLLNLTVRDAHTDDFGGGVANHGLLNVSHSQFLSNTANGGASIYNAPGASALVDSSLFWQNAAEGGAILNGDGSSAPSALIVSNSTFDFNQAASGAGVYNSFGPATVTASSFYFNVAATGGAVYNGGRLRLESNTFVDNGAYAPTQLAGPQAPHLPQGSVHLLGGGALYAEPDADTLVAGSVFTGNFAVQAGGAVLYSTLPLDSNVTVSVGGMTILGSRFDDNCTGGAGGAIANSQALTVSDSIFTFNGAFAQGCAFLGSQSPAHFPAQPQAAAGLPNSLLGPGGAIFNGGVLRVDSSTFLTNTALITLTHGGGGAIDNWFATHTEVVNSTFSGNTTHGDGGALNNESDAILTISGSDFERNLATRDSGGAVANRGALTVTNSLFTANGGAPGFGLYGKGGGAIYSDNGPTHVILLAETNAPLGPNGSGAPETSPPEAPAGLSLVPNQLFVDHSRFISNSSGFEGGAIDASAARLVNNTFMSNTAVYGGAMDVLSDSVFISASTFIGNAAIDGSAGAARQGGAIDSNGYAMSILNSTFFANHATGNAIGGAIEVEDGFMAITNTTFLSNSVDVNSNGGALAQNAGVLLHNVLLAYNAGGNCDVLASLDSHDVDYPGTTCSVNGIHTNPLALPPANNGGPTLTSALQPTSPAINTGDDAGCPSLDQRGAHRPAGSHCDIGAFEFNGLIPWLWLPLVRK